MKKVNREPIAVIGTACKFPGKVNNIEEYWAFLKEGKDAVCEVPNERWDWAYHYDEDINKVGKSFVKKACFIDWDIEAFDAAFFDISPREAAVLDPQQRLLMEVTFEALEDATGNVNKLKGSNTGVYMGCFMQDNLITQMGSGGAKSQLGTYTAVSSTMTMISNRLSYVFDLQGPSFTLDTACSSSLVAIHQACRGLLAGDCEMAIAGGVNVMHRPEIMVMMSKGHFLAKDGRSKTFSAHADGYGRGEGAGIVVLKRYADALRDGDTIHGLILGSGVNQDGHTDGITVPSQASQTVLARRVYEEAGINPDDIAYIEAHGTGTPVGDPIEMRAMGAAISQSSAERRAPLVVGSVKAGLGHLEAAAGVAGFLKSLLVTKYGEIPPQAWLDEELNPAIDFAGLNLQIADKLQAVPQSNSGKSYVAVNSFGYGGTNAHAVLAKAPDVLEPLPQKCQTRPQKHNEYFSLNISAASESACEVYAKHYLSELESCNERTALLLCRDVAAKSQLTHRWTISSSSLEGLKQSLAIAIEDKKSENVSKSKAHKIQKPVFVFSGMGPQWWAMGQDLMKTEALFAEKLKQADKLFQNISGWSILDEMMKPENESKMLETQIAQVANFMIQMGVYELLKSWGIKPTAVVGHSVGEVSSAYAAGALTLEDALLTAYHRSRTQAKTAGTGTMIATALSQAHAEKYISQLEEGLDEHDKGKISIAGINSASNTTMSGDEEILDKVIADLESQDIFVRKLRVEVPYHSAGMDPILEELESSLADLSPQAPSIALYSTVTGERVDSQGFNGAYWCKNVRQPVYFEQAIQALLADGHELFVEIGPHPVLSSYVIESILKSDYKGSCISTLKRKENSDKCLRSVVASLWTSGVEVDFVQYLGKPNRRAKLLSYPWQRKIHWSETKYDQQTRKGWSEAHPLLGRRLANAVPTWQSELSSSVIPWLADHKVGENVVFPGAGYIETLLAAMNETAAIGRKMVMRDIFFHRALVLNSTEDATLNIIIENANQVKIFAGLASKQDQWQIYAQASLLEGEFEQVEENPIQSLDLDKFENISVEGLYQSFSDVGLDYGEQFQSIKQLKRFENQAIIDLEASPDSRWNIHPALLDGAFQGMLALLEGASSTAYLPVQVEEIRLYKKLKSSAQALCSITSMTDRFIQADIKLMVDDELALEVLGVRCDAVQLSTDAIQTDLEKNSFRLGWYQEAYTDENLSASNKVAVIGENIPDEFAQSLVELGAEDVLLFQSITQFSQYEDVNALETLAVFVHSDSAEDAVLDAAAMVTDFQTLHASGYAGTVALITHEALAAQVRHALNNWNTAWVTGFRRCAHNELSPMTIRHIDIDHSVNGAALAVELSVENAMDEVALTRDERWAMQFTRIASQNNYGELKAKIQRVFKDKGNNNFELKTPSHKSLASLAFEGNSRISPASEQIEVKVDSVALNYKDYAKVNGLLTEKMLETSSSGMTLGLECEGVVVRLGQGVEDYTIGDKVAVMAPDCFKRYITVNTNPRTKPKAIIKSQLSGFKAGQSAASCVAYGTALWGLRDVAHLKTGESVLIHGAAGGVGLAALYVAKYLGAVVIASAGTPEKRDYLLAHGADHVVNSRTLNFIDDIKVITKGEGVDVVLNSASGGIVDLSLEALASFGRFIEIGKKDIFEAKALNLAVFEKGISYSTLDFEHYMQREDEFEDLMDDVFELLEKGDLAALEIRSFGASNIQEAFTYLARSQQTGKVCIDMNDMPLVAQYKQRSRHLAPEKCMIITGGLGGLGLMLSEWCIHHGANKLVLLGRKGAASDEAKAAVKKLQAQGAEVDVYACDAIDLAALRKVFDEVEKKWPIGGVIHTAGVLDDRLLLDLDEEAVIKVAQPKIIGVENLHVLTKDKPSVDVFWAISSIAAFSGNMHQTNYALANTYMDGLMEARQAIGLPGNTIQLGPIKGAGMATKNEDLEKYLALRGMHYMDQDLFHAAFTRVMEWNIPIMTIAILDWAVWEYAEPRAASSHRSKIIISEEGANNSADSVLNSLAQLPAQKRSNVVGYIIIEHVAEVLQMDSEDVELDAPLESFGIDSLAAVELQLHINKTFQVEISILSMLGGKTILDIATELVGLMNFDQGAPVATLTQPPPPVVANEKVANQV